MLIACDLGGTKSQWAAFDLDSFENGEDTPMLFQRYEVANTPNFYDHLYEFLDHVEDKTENIKPCRHLTLAISGRVDHDRVSPTNIPHWDIELHRIKEILGKYGHNTSTSIINDFEVLGYSLLYYQDRGFNPDDLTVINGVLPSEPKRGRRRREAVTSGDRSLICGPGTGLGISCVIDGLERNGFPYIISSEGGHFTISPETKGMLDFLSASGDMTHTPSFEYLLSGPGLVNAYNYFRTTRNSLPEVGRIKAKSIIDNMTSDIDARDAVELFSTALAVFCGNMANTFNCNKAVYLWGSVVQNIPTRYIETRFANHFSHRKHGEKLRALPVAIIKPAKFPLVGGALYGQYVLQNGSAR